MRQVQYTRRLPAWRMIDTAAGLVRYDEWCAAEAQRLSRIRAGVEVRPYADGACAVWGPKTRAVE